MNSGFSIIMPNYNSKLFKKSIVSVINQSYKDWELIIIDNYSKNRPEEIVKKFKNQKIFFYSFNNGNNIAKSRNFGISKSKFKWIAFLDSDDLWEKDKLKIVKENIDKYEPDLLYHGMYYLPKFMGIIQKEIKNKSREVQKPIYKSLIVDGNGIANSSVVVKKDLIKRIGYISEDPKKFSWEDYDCWIRCARETNNFFFIPTILGYCWVGGGNISNLDQTYVNYVNFHKIYKQEILELTKSKKLHWFEDFLILWNYKKKRILQAYALDKKNIKKNYKILIRSLIIKVLFFFKHYLKLKKK